MLTKINPAILKQIFENQSEAQVLDKQPCFLFNRVSTKNNQQETSLEQQEYDSFRYAEKKGFHVAFNFRVQETASKEDQRHAFNQMVKILKSDLISVKQVILKSADRGSRNKFDKVVLDKLRKNHGISIHYYSSGKVLHGSSHYTEELQDDLENLFATHFSRELSHKIQSAYHHKVFEKKQAPSPRSPFGYFWDKNKKQHKIDPNYIYVVRKMFQEFDSNDFNLAEFVEYCNKKSLLPKSGIPWQKGRMENFLKNPFYCGWFRFKGGIYEGSHEALFSNCKIKQPEVISPVQDSFDATRSSEIDNPERQGVAVGMVFAADDGGFQIGGNADDIALDRGRKLYRFASFKNRRLSRPDQVAPCIFPRSIRWIRSGGALAQ